MRNKSLLLLVPAALILSGCATCNKRVDNLEARVGVLENKMFPAQEKEPAPVTQATTETTASLSQEKVTPGSPTKTEIQTALKNAGYYSGPMDGKIGDKTKKAIEDFQTANGLKADGKVGANTWNKLKKYL